MGGAPCPAQEGRCGLICHSGGVTEKRRVVFRGGVRGGRDARASWWFRTGNFGAPWPLGTLTVDSNEVRISSPVGADAVANSGDGSVVVLRRAGIFGIALEIQRGGRIAPQFLPRNPGRVLTTLNRFGWRVRLDVPKPRRLHTRLLIVIALVLLALALGEELANNNRANDMNARAKTVEGHIEATKRLPRGGCCYAMVTFPVDGQQFNVTVIVQNGEDAGDPMTIRYDPHDPGIAWADGDGPPGTDGWFGPIGVILAIILLLAYRRRRSLDRHLAREDF
jgi:hypothetical protein